MMSVGGHFMPASQQPVRSLTHFRINHQHHHRPIAIRAPNCNLIMDCGHCFDIFPGSLCNVWPDLWHYTALSACSKLKAFCSEIFLPHIWNARVSERVEILSCAIPGMACHIPVLIKHIQIWILCMEERTHNGP